MSKKIVKSISVDPTFYTKVEKLATDNRVPVSVIVEEALKQAIEGINSLVLENILKRANNG